LTEASRPAGPRHILIADDKASSRELLRSILEACGHTVAEAEDGEEVLAKVESFTPDLVILDLQMPRLDGYATAAALRRMPALAQMPIIALTAAATQTAPERIKEAGFSAYLVKPIRPAELRQQVTRILQKSDG